MDDFDGLELLGCDELGAAGSDIPFGPMTEAEAKAAAAMPGGKSVVLAPGINAPTMTFLPSEGDNIWAKPTTWFKAPAWTGGPPRWQVTLGGVALLLGLGGVAYAVAGGKKTPHPFGAR